MQLSFTLAAATAVFFGVANAQLPFSSSKCAEPCIATALMNQIGDCKMVDPKCICSNKAFIESIGTCIMNSCPEAEFQQVLRDASKFCSQNGVDITQNLPKPSGNNTQAPNATTSASATSTPEPTGAANSIIAGGAGVVGAAVAALMFM